jgi:hypothetical protein
VIQPERPRLPKALVRRLDRLAHRAHLFHRYAHHPLCEEYGGEVLRVGRKLRVCRGCTFAAMGGAAGIATGLLLPLPSAPWLWALAAFGTGVMLWLTRVEPAPRDQTHHIPKARPKSLTRLLPAAALGALSTLALRLGNWQGWALDLVSVALLAATIARYRQRGPQRHPCATCPEAKGPVPCRGFQPMHRREQAFARLAARWLEAATRMS